MTTAPLPYPGVPITETTIDTHSILFADNVLADAITDWTELNHLLARALTTYGRQLVGFTGFNDAQANVDFARGIKYDIATHFQRAFDGSAAAVVNDINDITSPIGQYYATLIDQLVTVALVGLIKALDDASLLDHDTAVNLAIAIDDTDFTTSAAYNGFDRVRDLVIIARRIVSLFANVHHEISHGRAPQSVAVSEITSFSSAKYIEFNNYVSTQRLTTFTEENRTFLVEAAPGFTFDVELQAENMAVANMAYISLLIAAEVAFIDAVQNNGGVFDNYQNEYVAHYVTQLHHYGPQMAFLQSLALGVVTFKGQPYPLADEIPDYNFGLVAPQEVEVESFSTFSKSIPKKKTKPIKY